MKVPHSATVSRRGVRHRRGTRTAPFTSCEGRSLHGHIPPKRPRAALHLPAGSAKTGRDGWPGEAAGGGVHTAMTLPDTSRHLGL